MKMRCFWLVNSRVYVMKELQACINQSLISYRTSFYTISMHAESPLNLSSFVCKGIKLHTLLHTRRLAVIFACVGRNCIFLFSIDKFCINILLVKYKGSFNTGMHHLDIEVIPF